jgi:hypothetical protein
MLQFSKLLSILSLLAIIYSVFGMNLEQENVVFYLGTLIVSITVFVLSIGIFTINIINKISSQQKNSDELKH